MSPVITKEYTFVEPVVGDIPFVPSRIIIKIDGLDESDVHDLVVEVDHRNLCRMVTGGSGRVGKDDASFTRCSGASHSNESSCTGERES